MTHIKNEAHDIARHLTRQQAEHVLKLTRELNGSALGVQVCLDLGVQPSETVCTLALELHPKDVLGDAIWREIIALFRQGYWK